MDKSMMAHDRVTKLQDGDLFSVAAYDASPVRARSDAQEEASELIAGRTRSVGNVLASDNAPFYVAILSALADFRAGHEFEPLFEDLRDAVLGESPSQRQIDEFNADLAQLEDYVYVSGGLRGVSLKIRPSDLALACSGEFADFVQ